ncbi:hypothetical protein [Cupriavidus taiwanensis]|uniref:hypothetical protein n=1 Tax=Cupriavidus taiwanensis TaxID=164546 RepID=UPI0039C2293F
MSPLFFYFRAYNPRIAVVVFLLDQIKQADMLSPHEIAALLLLGDTQDIDDLEPEQLDGLLVNKLVMTEHGTCPRLTSQGNSIVEMVRRIR